MLLYFKVILNIISTRSIWPIVGILATLSQSGLGKNGNKTVTAHSLNIQNRTLTTRCILVSYPEPFWRVLTSLQQAYFRSLQQSRVVPNSCQWFFLFTMKLKKLNDHPLHVVILWGYKVIYVVVCYMTPFWVILFLPYDILLV